MDYVVTAVLTPPSEQAELDGLQQEGVTALLDRQLALVEGVAGPEDRDIDVLDYRITAHPQGATVVLALDAPTLASAEEAAATVLDELLGESDLLLGWSVAESEVRITEDEFNQSLAAADSDEAESALEAAVDEVLEGSGAEEPPLDTEHWRTRLTGLGDQLRAFDLSSLGETASARLAAGALIHAVRVVTDEIFYDEMSLAVNSATVDDAVGLLVLEELPPYFRDQYDSLFARAFLLASASVAERLTLPEWTPPRNIAEALAVRLFFNEAQVVLEAARLMSWQSSKALFDELAGRAFRDREHEELYELTEPADQTEADRIEATLRARGLAFDQWFHGPGGHPEGLHPYHQSI